MERSKLVYLWHPSMDFTSVWHSQFYLYNRFSTSSRSSMNTVSVNITANVWNAKVREGQASRRVFSSLISLFIKHTATIALYLWALQCLEMYKGPKHIPNDILIMVLLYYLKSLVCFNENLCFHSAHCLYFCICAGELKIGWVSVLSSATQVQYQHQHVR